MIERGRERMKRERDREGEHVRQRNRVIYDTQTEGATAINMCLGTLQTDQPCPLASNEFVDCGDQSSQTWKDCFTSLLDSSSCIQSQNSYTDGGALSENKLA